MSAFVLSGGCQCGAVRYALLKQPERPCTCHCRMCQKAMGNVFGTFAGVEREFFRLTRGEFSVFRSSEDGERLFCNQCGTPLGWRSPHDGWTSVTIGSLDQPERVQPTRFYGEEGRISWTTDAAAAHGTTSGAGGDWPIDNIKRTNRQHPDHDTAAWPPADWGHFDG